MLSMTAGELADAIRQKRIGVEELTRAYFERIEKYDGPGGLNSIAEHIIRKKLQVAQAPDLLPPCPRDFVRLLLGLIHNIVL